MAKRIRKRDLIIEFLQLITGIGVTKGKKAAPRFELGIKDLQSSALPLGHAAIGRDTLFPSDRISLSTEALLVLSNGHGEDLIALRVLEALHDLRPDLNLEVLPMVGEGNVFRLAISEGWLKRKGPCICLPSGGFSNQSLRGLVSDLSAGLLTITWQQWLYVKNASKNGRIILAVGDLLPLFFAWSSGASFGFIGTPKSDYTWRSGPGRAISDHYHRLKGTEWDPWEYLLMRSSRCSFVAVRDQLTARGLRRLGVHAEALGNPMMDGFKNGSYPDSLEKYRRLLVLCGSRSPEAEANFKRFFEALDLLNIQTPIACLVAISSGLSLETIQNHLEVLGYQRSDVFDQNIGSQDCWVKGTKVVLIGVDQFSRWASWAEVGLANAGTATEQLVGLGIPALSLPGKGPQFKQSFAFRQSRLLGGSVIACDSAMKLIELLEVILRDKSFRVCLGAVGIQRMGPAGGSAALAKVLSGLL